MKRANPLVREIETFLKTPGVHMTETAFGVTVLNDGKFMPTLRAGRRVWPETAQKVRKFMAAELRKLRAAHGDQRAAA